MKQGERQVAPTLKGIRRDHVARYEFAAKLLAPKSRFIDFACGVGYGANVLAKAGHHVTGIDIDAEALAYARRYYKHKNAVFLRRDGNEPPVLGEAGAAVCFETIEHIEDPRPLLKALHTSAPMLIASVPNEDVMPWRFEAEGREFTTAFHYRHYTRRQFSALLHECGWEVNEGGWYGQAGPESEVEPDVNGRTLIAVCHRRKEASDVPEHVAIVGLGPSSNQ